MAIGSMNVSNNSKINDEIKSLHNKDTELENTLNTKANNDDIAVRSVSKDYIQLTNAEDANMLLDHAPANMLNVTCTSQTVNGLTITVNPDKTIYVKGTATATTEFNIGNFNVTKGQTFSFGQAKSVNGNVGDDGTSWNNCIYFKGYDGTSNWKFDGIFTATVTTDISCKLYVRSGTTVDGTYYPRVYYENKRYAYVPPTGYEVTACGKNLLNAGKFTSSTFYSANISYDEESTFILINNQYTGGGADYDFDKQIVCYLKEGETYSFSWKIVSGTMSGRLWIKLINYDTRKYGMDEIEIMEGETTATQTFVAKYTGIHYLRIGLQQNCVFESCNMSFMVEEGDTAATTYEPFKGTSVSINKDTKFPLEGLKSLNGLTNIYNSYGATMDVSYASNASGQSIMNKITMIEDNLNKNTIHWVDYNISGIELQIASTSTPGYYYSEQIYPDIPSNAKIVSVTSCGNFTPGLSYSVFENSFAIIYINKTTVDNNRNVRVGYILT